MSGKRLGHLASTTSKGTHGLELWEIRGQHHLISFVHVDGWRAEMKLTLQDGRPVVCELRIASRSDDLPTGGITSRLLRQVQIHAHVQTLADYLRWPHRRDALAGLLAGTGLENMLTASAPAVPTTPRKGRRPIPIDTLVRVAEAYAGAAAKGSAPVKDAAITLAMPAERVRDLIHRARKLGLLTPATWGRSGGALTPRAKALRRRNVPANVPAADRTAAKTTHRQPMKKRKTSR